MRKLYLAVTSCVALVAFLAFSATAFGLNDPRCEQAGNPIEILDWNVTTPESSVQHQTSSVFGAAYACGSDIDIGFGGASTLNNHADVGVPEGVRILNSDKVPVGSWAATAFVNILYHDPYGDPHFDEAVLTSVRTDNKAECQRELDDEIVGATPGNEEGSVLVTCLKGVTPVGGNWSWAVRDANDKLWLTVGPMHAPYGIEPGLTMMDMQLCGLYGAVGSTECGTTIGPNSVLYQQRNGDAAYPLFSPNERCLDSGPWTGKGIYTVTATQEGTGPEGGPVTAAASSCVPWGS